MAIDPVTAVLEVGGKLIERLWPDPVQADAAKLELLKLQQSGALVEIAGQLEINKIEAANTNIFVSGWRPFIGWCCGAALAYHFLVRPLLIGFVQFPMPALDTVDLFGLTTQMLGMAAARTVEKINGVAAT